VLLTNKDFYEHMYVCYHTYARSAGFYSICNYAVFTHNITLNVHIHMRMQYIYLFTNVIYCDCYSQPS